MIGDKPSLDGGEPKQLLASNKVLSAPVKAKDADVYMLTAQTFNEFPDLVTTDGSFKELRDQMKFVFVTDIREVLDASLEPSGRKVASGIEAENGHERPKRRRGERAAAKAQVS